MALGLSGGGDSLALLLIAKRWADRRGRSLLALTVDHGLHPDSDRWTAAAGAAAARIGVAWRALPWTGDKPASGLPAAARRARHSLLAEAARDAGARVILLGHTRDDLAETALMRRRDAPSLGVMGEWSPSPAWPEGRGLFLLRSLLGVGRAELRTFLSEHGQTWLDDPANDDPRYARARARRALATATDVDVDETESEAIAPRGWRVTADGRVIMARAELRAMTGLRRFLSAALLCASGTDEPPRGERLERLIEALQGAGPVTASLAGARVTADAQTVQVGREAGERARGGLAPVALLPDAPVVWDGRYAVVADLGGRIEAMAGHLGRLSRTERDWLRALPPAARSALPVLVTAEGTATLPRPFGPGPALAACLVEARLLAACGAIQSETALAG